MLMKVDGILKDLFAFCSNDYKTNVFMIVQREKRVAKKEKREKKTFPIIQRSQRIKLLFRMEN